MHYSISRLGSYNPSEVSISIDQFSLAAEAHKRMQLFVASEEKFDAVARNYLDFESDMLTRALDFALVGPGQGMEHMGDRRLLNRKLSNLLSATRSYVDFIRHSAKIVLSTQADAKEVVDLFSKHYDASLAYRTLEVLRNHAQHASFPIQKVRYSITRVPEERGTSLKYTITPLVEIDELQQNKGLKKSVVCELAKRGAKLNLKRFVREYIASMASVHGRFRELASPIFSQDASIIQELAQFFSSSNEIAELPAPLYAVSFDGTTCLERISLDDSLRKYGDFLAAGNVNFAHAANCFVSGEQEEGA